ncbi:MAG: protein kinase [Actinomycetota bacterium]|nr:protein kinase [Actinomycetota bacterium]
MSASFPGASTASLPPAILAQRYRLERRLAQGGMAEVWLGTDLSLTRQVAVKLLKPQLAADPVVAERFRREAIAVALLSHPNIVAVYDAIDDTINGERRQAVVMQLVNGKSLRQLLDEQKRLSPDLTMHIGACVAAALDCAHQANLVHRDVKPGNIMITPDGRVLLTDFGIAKGLHPTADDDLTSPNVMMGTAKYLSPEQVRGRKLDGRADLYSLGLVLYECLAGRVPFLGETDADTALARLNRDPTDLTRLRPTLPHGLAPLIHRLLSRRPDQRYATGADVRNELQRIQAQPRPDYDDPSRDVGRDPARDVTRQQTPSRGGPLPAGHVRNGAPATTTRQPTPVSGYQPARATGGRPAGAAMRADRTPPATTRPRQQPNRTFEHSSKPSMVIVGGLLLIAFVVGLVLWVTMGNDSSSGLDASVVTEAPVATGDGLVTEQLPQPSTTTQPAPATTVVRTFDPEGDGEERDDLVASATDGNIETAWMTVCYDSQYLNGKKGVGLVMDLGSARTGTLTVALGSGPYQVQFFGTGEGAQPTSFSAWGAAADKFSGQEATTLSHTFTTPVRYVLASFQEIAPDSGCSNNPYRGTIKEMGFTT